MPHSNHSDTSTPSPSVTLSTDSVVSTPLLSPKEDPLVIDPQPFQVKLSLDDIHSGPPCITSMTTFAQPRFVSLSPSPCPSSKRSINEHSHVKAIPPHSPRRYRPYVPRSGSIPPGLHYAARSLGMASPTNITLHEVKEKKDSFLDALSAMPDRILKKAFRAKRADHSCIALRLALATAEMRFSQERTSFLSTVHEQHHGDLATSGAFLDIFNQALNARGVVEVGDNEQYYRDEHAAQLAALTVSGALVDQMYDAIGPGCSRWLSAENGGSRTPFWGEDSDEEDGDEEDGDEEDGEEEDSEGYVTDGDNKDG